MGGTYKFKPYQDKEYQIWLCLASACTIGLVMHDSVEKWYIHACAVISACLFWINTLITLAEYLTEVEISENGICIRRGKHTVIPLKSWDCFSGAYILDVSWTDTDTTGFRKKRYGAYFFVLSEEELTNDQISDLSSRLANYKPCGKFRKHIVIRTNAAFNEKVKVYVGDKIPFIEIKKNAEGELLHL